MSNNNEPNGENNKTVQNAKRDSRAGISNVQQPPTTPEVKVTGNAGTTGSGGGNVNVVTNENRGVNTTAEQTQENKPENPFKHARTASVFKGKNKIAGNPFADGDGGGDAPVVNNDGNNTQGGKVVLDKTQLSADTRFLLRHYLDLANPVYNVEKVKLTVKRRDGTVEEVERQKPVFKGYEFYAVDGKPFDEWLKANIGEGFKIDPLTKEIYKESS